MKTCLQIAGLTKANLPVARPLHLAIGMFDGVHLGHQSVIEAAIHSAQRSDGLAGVLTFWPHPSALFSPDKATSLLMTPTMKRQVLAKLGVDFIVEEPFTPDFAQRDAGDFVQWLRQCLPQLKSVYVGENWRFGRNRSGDVALLVKLAGAAGIHVFSAPRLNLNGSPISSSRIRELVSAGDLAEANELLGYAYFSEGRVLAGRRLGRTIGFPTLNIAWEPALKPRYGVYAVEISAGGGVMLPAVANYGLRPTVGAVDTPLLEVHVLKDTNLTYGDSVTVNWLSFLRAEVKFTGVEALREQIGRDAEMARQFFQKNSQQ